MQAKQRNIKIFDISCQSADELETLLSKNGTLIKNYLVVLKGCPKECEDVAKKYELRYVLDNGDFPRYSISKKELLVPTPEEESSSAPKKEDEAKSHLVEKKTLRSGSSISHSGVFTLFGRINSGARVEVDGEATIYGDIDGFLEVRGEFIILKGKVSGSIIFNGEILENSCFNGELKKVVQSNEKVVVEDM